MNAAKRFKKIVTTNHSNKKWNKKIGIILLIAGFLIYFNVPLISSTKIGLILVILCAIFELIR